MGAPGPVACFNEGEIAWLEQDVYDALAWRRSVTASSVGGPTFTPWMVEVEADATSLGCRTCQKEFAPAWLAKHMAEFHGARVDVSRETSAGEAKRPGEHICFTCRPIRRFDTPRGLSIHRGHMHKDDGHVELKASGTDPP
jgi:hypothetical protein